MLQHRTVNSIFMGAYGMVKANQELVDVVLRSTCILSVKNWCHPVAFNRVVVVQPVADCSGHWDKCTGDVKITLAF